MRTIKTVLAIALSGAVAAQASEAGDKRPPMVQEDGSILVQEQRYAMPGSFSDEARQAFTGYFARGGDPQFSGDIHAIRTVYDEQWAGPILAQWLEKYPSRIERRTVAGVTVDIVEPAAGVPAAHADKVLISLHGGGFAIGNGGVGGKMEAVPMASVGGYRVYAVDYRQAPEATYPAATDDVVAVYKALLKDYKPENIGIVGSSAGGMLTAQAVARLNKDGLPGPGAIAIQAAGATASDGASDSRFWMLGLTGGLVKIPEEIPHLPQYFSAADRQDPMAFPGGHPDLLAKFPPTLILSSSRDALLGNALDTFANLRAANVESHLYVRHGFGHGYFTQVPDVPEAIAAWDETAKHFKRYLGGKH